MKVIGLFLLGLIIFVVIAVGGLFLALILINEERKAKCGKCDFYDHDLQHCWLRGITTGPEDEGCVGFNKSDNEHKD